MNNASPLKVHLDVLGLQIGHAKMFNLRTTIYIDSATPFRKPALNMNKSTKIDFFFLCSGPNTGFFLRQNKMSLCVSHIYIVCVLDLVPPLSVFVPQEQGLVLVFFLPGLIYV